METEATEVKTDQIIDDGEEKKIVEDRQNLIDTAVRFLTNQKVKQTPDTAKREFLTKKGLTPSEVNAALEKASKIAVQAPTSPAAPMQAQNQIVPANNVSQPKPSFLMVVMKWIRNFIVAGCLAFTAYKLIAKKLMSKKKKKIEIAVDELEKSNDKLINKLAEMHYIMYDLKESVNVMSIALKHTAKNSLNSEDSCTVKNEIQTIKNLLLNRSQFPNVPTMTPILPSWQLEKKNPQKEKPHIVDESDKEVTNEEVSSEQSTDE